MEVRLPGRLRACDRRSELVLLNLPDPLVDETMPSEARLVSAFWHVDRAVGNGGFEGLVTNPSGDHVPLAKEFAETAGLRAVHGVLLELVALFGDSYPADLSARELTMSSWSESTWRSVEGLDDSWDFDVAEAAIREWIKTHDAVFWVDGLEPEAEARIVLALGDDLISMAAAGDDTAREAVAEAAKWAEVQGSDTEQSRAAYLQRRQSQLDRWANEE